jgi:hypothetical protein
MDKTTKKTFRRLVDEFKSTGSLLEGNGERPDLIAEAMIETGIQALIRLAGPEKVAAKLHKIADRIDKKEPYIVPVEVRAFREETGCTQAEVSGWIGVKNGSHVANYGRGHDGLSPAKQRALKYFMETRRLAT